MKGIKGSSPHGYLRYRSCGCRCDTCVLDWRRYVRAQSESACAECGGPCWGRWTPGRRCQECVRLGATSRRPLQPRGLTYQWGCP